MGEVVKEKGWVQIGIRPSTYAKLVELKRELNVGSLDEVIRKLVEHFERSSRPLL